MPNAKKPPNRRSSPADARAANNTQERFADPTLAEVLAQVISAVQSQKVPAEAALRAAMEGLSTAQKSVLELSVKAAEAQANLVHELLARDHPKLGGLQSDVTSLLTSAVESGLELLNALGFTELLTPTAASPGAGNQKASNSSPAPTPGPPEEEQISPAAATESTPPRPETEPQSTPESLLDPILAMIAQGYSADQPGDAVARSICADYPAAVSTIQQYLAMDDFLVLLWMRQQPALAEIAAREDFPQFYAQLKTGFEQPRADA